MLCVHYICAAAIEGNEKQIKILTANKKCDRYACICMCCMRCAFAALPIDATQIIYSIIIHSYQSTVTSTASIRLYFGYNGFFCSFLFFSFNSSVCSIAFQTTCIEIIVNLHCFFFYCRNNQRV